MARREKYIARLLQAPAGQGLTEVRMINMPQVSVARWPRLKCQYSCSRAGDPAYLPPATPTAAETAEILETYRFGLLTRSDVDPAMVESPEAAVARLQEALLRIEQEAFSSGYARAFLLACGNCLFCHRGEGIRPCAYPGKARPSLEAIGVDLSETLHLIGWEEFLNREPDAPLPLFGLLLLE